MNVSPIEFKSAGSWCVGQCAVQTLSEPEVVDQFESDCRDKLSRDNPRFFVVDMSGVSFVVTRALSTLLMLHKKQREAGGCLALCGVDSNVARVLRLTRLDRVFDIYPDLNILLSERPDGAKPAAPAPGFGP